MGDFPTLYWLCNAPYTKYSYKSSLSYHVFIGARSNSAPAQKSGFVVMETNFRVMAYTGGWGGLQYSGIHRWVGGGGGLQYSDLQFAFSLIGKCKLKTPLVQ